MRKKKKPSAAAVNSRLVSRPIRKCFPIFMLPTFLAFCVGFIWPFVQGMYLSFCKFTLPSDAQFVALDNYAKAFSDAGFRHSMWYTALFAVVSIILINFFAFLIAYLLTQNIKGSNIFRTVFYMPNLIGGIVLGYIWSMIFDGILSKYGTYLLAKSEYGFWGLIILMCWQQIGYMMIIYVAGLQNVPPDLLEAAAIDGANAIQTLIKVKLPMLMSSFTICLFLTITNSFKLFDQNLALTAGEPAHATEMLALNIYNTFYARSGPQWKGIGQAKAVIFFILVVVISLSQLYATRSKEVQA